MLTLSVPPEVAALAARWLQLPPAAQDFILSALKFSLKETDHASR
ncbi:MAG: hypothetical protein ACRELB_11830 [Polyangiaceae bacterium]